MWRLVKGGEQCGAGEGRGLVKGDMTWHQTVNQYKKQPHLLQQLCV